MSQPAATPPLPIDVTLPTSELYALVLNLQLKLHVAETRASALQVCEWKGTHRHAQPLADPGSHEWES